MATDDLRHDLACPDTLAAITEQNAHRAARAGTGVESPHALFACPFSKGKLSSWPFGAMLLTLSSQMRRPTKELGRNKAMQKHPGHNRGGYVDSINLMHHLRHTEHRLRFGVRLRRWPILKRACGLECSRTLEVTEFTTLAAVPCHFLPPCCRTHTMVSACCYDHHYQLAYHHFRSDLCTTWCMHHYHSQHARKTREKEAGREARVSRKRSPEVRILTIQSLL